MAGSVDSRLAGHRLTIDLGALAANYRLMADYSAPAKAAAVVKADAYGMGAEAVVPALLAAGCDTFFVAVPDEGIAVRRLAPQATIFVLGGIFPETLHSLVEARLTPVLSTLAAIDMWADHLGRHGIRKPCAIQLDTGMNRLGLSVEEAAAFAERNAAEHVVTPILMMSHLACADEPQHPLNRQQAESFQKLAALFPDIDSSLANSGGVLLGPDFRFTMTRPGIALYGGNPVNRAANPVRPVVTAEARIAQVRQAKAGETVSYGATVTLTRDTRIAVASAGYADGYHRASSGSGVPLRGALPAGGRGFISGRAVPILGRVTMDLTMFDVTDLPASAVKVGDWVELFGPNIPIDEVADAAGTISYELLTGLGRRAHRRYVEG